MLTKTDHRREGVELLLAEVPCLGLKPRAEGSLLALRAGFRPLGGENFRQKANILGFRFKNRCFEWDRSRGCL